MNKTRTNGFSQKPIYNTKNNNTFYDKFRMNYEEKNKKVLFNFHNYQTNLPFIKTKDNSISKFNNIHPFYREIFSLNNAFLLRNNNKTILKKEERATSQNNRENSINLFLDSNDKLSKYIIGKEIGKGAYAKVKLVTDKFTNIKYAMKIYDRSKLTDSAKKRCVFREIEIMKRSNHKNIVKLKEVIYTQKEILIIMELINGISLRDYYNKNIRNQKNLSEEKEKIIKEFFKQIFSAMGYLHRNHMAHRDIKLENILLDNNKTIKIIDFGFGMYNPENRLQNFFCGTPNYMSPEIASKRYYKGQNSDLWSLGVLLYKMCCADFPFKGANEKDLYKYIKKGTFTYPNYINEHIKKVINNLIVVDPDKRIGCEYILNLTWFVTDNYKNQII